MIFVYNVFFFTHKCALSAIVRCKYSFTFLEKLCSTANYGTESYTFSHKSVALSAVVRCKYSFYFFLKNPPHAWFLSPKTRLNTKKIIFFQKRKNIIVLLKTH